MLGRYIAFMALEEVIVLGMLAYAYARYPGRIEPAHAAIVLALCAAAILVTDSCVYLQNRGVVWQWLRMREKLLRWFAAFTAAFTAFLVAMACGDRLFGIWISFRTLMSFSAMAGFGFGSWALIGFGLVGGSILDDVGLEDTEQEEPSDDDET